MLVRRFGALAGALAVAVAIAGCGGSSSSGVSPAAYVKSVCNSVGPFEKDINARTAALQSNPSKTPAQGKAELQGFLSAVASDTDKALSQLKAAGTPNVDNGGKIETAIVKAFTQLDSAMKQAATSANSLSTTSVSAFQSGATALGTTVKTSMNGIGSSLTGLKSPALEKAAAKEPSCSSING